MKSSKYFDETQMTLITSESSEFLSEEKKQELNKRKADGLTYTENYCLKYLKTSQSVWDMRCWKKHKDQEEIRSWISKDNPDHKNDGHAGFCIVILRDEHKVPIDTIIETIRANPHIQYEGEDYIGSDIFEEFNKQMKEEPEVEVHSF